MTSLSFRSDGQPIMVSASRAGHLAIWDLEERKLTGQMRQAHDAEVAAVNCLTQEPLMVTSSPDNTLKQVRTGIREKTCLRFNAPFPFFFSGSLICPMAVGVSLG